MTNNEWIKLTGRKPYLVKFCVGRKVRTWTRFHEDANLARESALDNLWREYDGKAELISITETTV